MGYDKHELLERCDWICECGCGGRAEDGHHCLFSQRKRYPMLDVMENIVMITHAQNVSREFDNAESRKMFFKIQVGKYGDEHMLNWLKSLPEIVLKHYNDFCRWEDDKIIYL